MDLMAAIGLLSSIVTLEEAGRSWVLIVKDKLKRKEIDINNWDSDDPLVQTCLDRFKTDMGDKYKNHIFSEEEIQEIIRGFFEQNRELRIGNEEKKQMTQIIEDILYAYNEYTKSLMSSGERTLHNTLSSDFSKIMDKLGVIEEQPHKENIKKFLRAIEISKEIELENIEELINGEYEIDRSEIIETIQAGREKLVSIQGNAGSGKSVVCKKLLKGKEYVLVTRAENLSTGKKVNELWDCDVEDAILWLENKPLYIFIDAIEFIADCGDNAFPLLQEIYRLADKYSNVYIITSCRTTDSSAFMKINTKYRIKTYEIPDLAKDEIDKVAKSYPIILSLQQNKKYSDLLCVPFYLNLIVSGGFVEENINDENNFRNLIWERIICLKDKCRKYGVSQSDVRNNVERIVFERARSFVVGVDSDIVDSDILEALKSEGIIVESKNKIRLKYDIFEDICFERYIDKAFDACHGSYNNFFDEIEKIGRCIYRRYQIWISNKLFVQEAREKFVYTLLTDNSIEAKWKKQTEIGIVKSKYCGLFFKEFQELLDETVVEELLDITNLYAFEAKINHSPALIMNVTPIGAARENLIGMVFEERISLDKNRTSIIKLCDDYANCFYKTADTEEKAYKIIIRYIDELIEKGKEEKSYYQHDEEIVQLFLIVAKMAKSSKSWLKEFVENMIVEYCSGTSRRDSVAEEILKAVVKKCPLSFAMELPELACESAETLWGQRVSRKHFKYDGYDHNNVRAYGLSDNADHFDNNENGVYNNTFFWYVMRCDFVKGLEWAISFVNNAVQTFAENKPDEITNIEIYFPKENKKRVYLGNEWLWMADIMEHNLPVVLTDISFVIKKTVINSMRNSSDHAYIKGLAEYVKNTIYEKANNILLLSIIESIGMNYQKEMPGYALELASSMELIYFDIHRSGEFISNPTKELLEKQIMLSMGVPEITRRYEKDEKCACNLQQYFANSYLCGDEGIKNNEYQNKRSEIIQEYLYDGKGIDLSEFDISNYDIDLLCNIACCGLDTADEKFVIVINSIVQCMIEIWHENCKEMRAHEIIDTFQEHKVSSYFQRELNMTGRNPEAVYDILFKGTDFSIFTRDTVDFYEDVLSGFLVSYVDGFREKGKRDDIEKKIRILETYVNSIPEDYVRNILEKRLFLCKGRFSRWDVNKVKAEYSYKDKCFLNVQIEKYGSNHLNDVLYTVYLLNISELLPEILISISSCFTKAIRNSKEQFAKEITDSQVIVDMIILKSFIFYSDEIKKDEKLINAYEDILLALTEIRNEKAAVLLDEFRIH